MTKEDQPESLEKIPVTLDALKDAIKSSGYLLEQRVAATLEDRAYNVRTSEFVPDPRDEEKAVEIDVMAYELRTVDSATESYTGTVLNIECKNNALPVVFFTKSQPHPQLNQGCIAYDGFPMFSATPTEPGQVRIEVLLEMSDWHHYCTSSEMATQFCSFNGGGKKLKVAPMQHYSESFSNLCLTTISNQKRTNTNKPNVELAFLYPIVVLQGDLYTAQQIEGDVELRQKNHVQLRHSAALGGEVVTRIIDVVTEQGLRSLLGLIEREGERTDEAVKRFLPRLLASAADQKRVIVQERAKAMFARRGK